MSCQTPDAFGVVSCKVTPLWAVSAPSGENWEACAIHLVFAIEAVAQNYGVPVLVEPLRGRRG